MISNFTAFSAYEVDDFLRNANVPQEKIYDVVHTAAGITQAVADEFGINLLNALTFPPESQPFWKYLADDTSLTFDLDICVRHNNTYSMVVEDSSRPIKDFVPASVLYFDPLPMNIPEGIVPRYRNDSIILSSKFMEENIEDAMWLKMAAAKEVPIFLISQSAKLKFAETLRSDKCPKIISNASSNLLSINIHEEDFACCM